MALSEPLGSETVPFSEIAGVEVQAKRRDPRPVELGERMAFRLDLTRCRLFDAEDGRSLRRAVSATKRTLAG